MPTDAIAKAKMHQVRFQLDLTGPTYKGMEGSKNRRKGQGRGRREERGPTSEEGSGGKNGEGSVSPPNLKNKLRPWLTYKQQHPVNSLFPRTTWVR